MNEKMITISEKELNDIKEDAVNSKLFWIHQRNIEINRAKEQFDSELKKLQAENDRLQQANLDLSQNNAELRNRNDELNKQQDYMYKRLKERANSDRGLPNKKTFHGFVIESSRQVVEQYKDKYDVSHANTTWKTTFQTPFESGLPFKIVTDAVEKALNSEDLSREFGFVYQPTDNVLELHDTSDNILYKIQFSCDRNHGYWYIDVWSTDYITPSDNRINYCDDYDFDEELEDDTIERPPRP